MNRIRENNGKFQVLITPTQRFNAGFEFMAGNWRDEDLRNYFIIEYDNIYDAQNEAFRYPDLDWEKLVLFHQGVFFDLKKRLHTVFNENKINANLDAIYQSPKQVKETMFNRVAEHGKRFTVKYCLNDVIGFHITCPTFKQLVSIAQILEQVPRFRIFKKIVVNKVIHLVGVTDVGTTFEIILWPSLIAHWAQWASTTHGVSEETKAIAFKEALKKQNLIDN